MRKKKQENESCMKKGEMTVIDPRVTTTQIIREKWKTVPMK
jgi:hypothetical protein